MGTIAGFFNNLNVDDLCKKHNIQYMVETGTGFGDSVAWGVEQPYFKEVYSVEIHKQTYDNCVKRFESNSNVKIINQDSISFLTEICKLDGNILFFLDAHFPGCYHADNDGNLYVSIDIDANPEELNWPLELEIPLIQRLRQGKSDCIIIDDLRVYEYGIFDGPCPSNLMRLNPINEMGKCFLETHDLFRFYNNEGYAAFIPKDN